MDVEQRRRHSAHAGPRQRGGSKKRRPRERDDLLRQVLEQLVLRSGLEDFPPFGLPTRASLGSSSSGASSPDSGSTSTNSTNRSSNSPEPRPCSAEMGTGSPTPSEWNEAASGSWRSESTLFTTRSTGTLE